jgi:hypothetical protein
MQTSSALNGVFILSFSISAENAGIADSVAVYPFGRKADSARSARFRSSFLVATGVRIAGLSEFLPSR